MTYNEMLIELMDNNKVVTRESWNGDLLIAVPASKGIKPTSGTPYAKITDITNIETVSIKTHIDKYNKVNNDMSCNYTFTGDDKHATDWQIK